MPSFPGGSVSAGKGITVIFVAGTEAIRRMLRVIESPFLLFASSLLPIPTFLAPGISAAVPVEPGKREAERNPIAAVLIVPRRAC